MKKNCVKAILLVLLGASLVFSACSGKEETPGKADSGQEAEGTADGGQDAGEEKIFGDFTAQTLGGEEVTQELFGEAALTMVNVWATYCGPCIEEMPELAELSVEYVGEDVQIVGLISDVSEAGDETAMEIVEKTGAGYLHIVPSPELQSGFLTRVSVVPTTIFVDREGTMVGEAYGGARDKETWASIIEETLAEVEQ